jgi:hypothetical protein
MKALGLACFDMGEAAFAAMSLRQDHDARTRRLIETAMVVSYMRPFTRSSLLRATLSEYVPMQPPESDLHDRLKTLRDETYAHTDKEVERRFLFSLGYEAAGEGDWVPYGQRYTQFPNELLQPVVELCRRLSREMALEARRIWIELGRPKGEF